VIWRPCPQAAEEGRIVRFSARTCGPIAEARAGAILAPETSGAVVPPCLEVVAGLGDEPNRVSLSNSSRSLPFEAVDEGVLHRIARRDVVPAHTAVLVPAQHAMLEVERPADAQEPQAAPHQSSDRRQDLHGFNELLDRSCLEIDPGCDLRRPFHRPDQVSGLDPRDRV